MSESSGPLRGVMIAAPAADGSSDAMRRRGGLRWGIALVAVAVIVGALGTLGTLVSTATPPDAITYVPAGSLAVVEVRPDLPGDQRDALGALLLRIPGFSGVANLNDRVNAALDDAVGRISDGSRSWATDVRPYAAGAALMVVLPPGPSASPAPAASSAPSATPLPRELAVLTTEGSPGCAPLEAGRQVTIERYRDTDIRTGVVTPPAATASPAPSGRHGAAAQPRQEACAVTGRFVLLGDPSAVRDALDAKAQGRNVSGDNGYGAAFRALPEPHAAWGYLNARAAGALAGSLPLPSTLPMPSFARPSGVDVAALTPEWAAVEVRFTTSGAVVDAVMPDRRAALLAALPAPSGGAQRTSAPAASSTLAPALPPTTIALLESHDVASLLDALSAQAGAGTTDPLASLAPSLGGLNAASLGTALGGGVGQVGAVVVSSGDTLSAGLVAQVADASAVATTLDQLRLLGGLLGGVTSTDYKGTRILSIPVATLIRLSEGLGGTPRPGATAAPTLTPAPAPSAATNPLAGIAAGQVLSLAVRGNLLVIGLGDGLARAVVDTAAGASLADQAGYRSALTAAGTPNLGSLYLDLAALRSAGAKVGPVASAAPRASANPFMEAAGVVAGSLTSTDGLLRGRLVITVR